MERVSAMNKLLLTAFLVAVTGCGSDTRVAKDQTEVPLYVVRRLPSLVDALKPGMSPDQVMAALGLSQYHIEAVGSGPSNRFTYQFLLRPDYSLILVYDERRKPPGLLYARWNDDRKQSH
jgi:hypothetical protein